MCVCVCVCKGVCVCVCVCVCVLVCDGTCLRMARVEGKRVRAAPVRVCECGTRAAACGRARKIKSI